MMKIKFILLIILLAIASVTFVSFGFSLPVALVYTLIGIGILAIKPTH